MFQHKRKVIGTKWDTLPKITRAFAFCTHHFSTCTSTVWANGWIAFHILLLHCIPLLLPHPNIAIAILVAVTIPSLLQKMKNKKKNSFSKVFEQIIFHVFWKVCYEKIILENTFQNILYMFWRFCSRKFVLKFILCIPEIPLHKYCSIIIILFWKVCSQIVFYEF